VAEHADRALAAVRRVRQHVRMRTAFLARRALLAALAFACGACASAPQTRHFVLRLRPGQELKAELTALAREERLQAASVVSAVGSLTDVALRLANKEATTLYTGHFEVVSLSGYLADGEFHLHMAVSDGDGRTIGGHVMEGNRVYTTLVIAIQEHSRLRYRREFDPASGFSELVIDER
jgi:predicted DNA-binding protein with PD1-like motif